MTFPTPGDLASPFVDATSAPSARPESLLRRNLKLCTWDGLTAMPLVIMSQPGNAVIAALLTGTFALSTRSYGFITSLPFWFNFLQVLITPLLAQRLSPRTMSITGIWLQITGWIVLAVALPFIPEDGSGKEATFITIFSVIAFATAICGVSWNSWMQSVIPPRLRGKYLGRRNRLLYISMLVFLLAVSLVLASFDDSLPAYQVLFAVAIGLRIISAFAQQGMHTSSGAKPVAAERHWREQLGIVWADTRLKRFILFAALMGLAINLFSPFYPIFMLQQLHLSAARTNFILLIGPLAAAIAFPAWGRLLDRFGNIPVMIVSLVTWQLAGFAWAFMRLDNPWLLYAVLAAGGFTSPGYGIGVFNLLLKFTPGSARTMGMALFTSVSSLTAALGPIIGSNIIAWAQSRGHASLSVYHAVFALTPVMAISVCLLLRRLNEEKASQVTEVVDAMRNVRTLASLFGLGFLVNQIFYRHDPAQKTR